MDQKKSDKKSAMLLFLAGLMERHGLCQGCETLKSFLYTPIFAESPQFSIVNYWIAHGEKKLHLRPLFRLGKHEMPCMSFNKTLLFRLNKIANNLDDYEKKYNEIMSEVDNVQGKNIDNLKYYLLESTKLRKQTWDAFSRITNLPCNCVRIVNKWKNISNVFELPPCPFKEARPKTPFDINYTSDIYEQFQDAIARYNTYSRIMISMLQEYLQILCMGQKSKLISDRYGYRPEKHHDDFNWKSLESYVSLKLGVRLFLWPEKMQEKERTRLKNTIFNALFEIPNLTEFLPADTPPIIHSMLSDNYLTIYEPAVAHTGEFPEYPVINLFCIDGKLLTQKVFHENDGNNGLKINLKDDKSCLLVVHDDTKKSKKWLNKWQEQRKLKRYIELKKNDGVNLFSRITNLIESEKSNEDFQELDTENNIPFLTGLFDEDRYKNLRFMTILLEMAEHVYFGVDDLHSGNPFLDLIKTNHNDRKKNDLKKVLLFKPVVEVLIRRSPKKIEFEDIPTHFLQPTMTRTGNRLAKSWFVGKDGHNARNAAVLMALGNAVIDFIQNGIITEETRIAKEIRNIDDRLRRLEDRILQINLSDVEKTGRKRKRNISYGDRGKIPKAELREALLVGNLKQ